MPSRPRIFSAQLLALGVASLLLALAAPALLHAQPGQGQAQGPGGQGRAPERVNGRDAAAAEVLVRFRGALSPAALATFEAQVDADVREPLDRTSTLQRFRSRRFAVETLVSFFSQLPEVEYAEPNYIVSTTATPNDPSYASLWGLNNTTTPSADIGAAEAWDITKGGTTVVTGVVDTGIDYNHPDLAANMWRAPSAFTVVIAGQTITCAQGTRGFNAIRNTCDPLDDHNHGTHVAGTIGAVGNNSTGVVGVNWTTRLMGLKFLSSSGSGTTADAIKAIEFAIQAKSAFAATGGANVRILNNSWGGGGFSQALLDQISKANASDMLFVAAAGNSNVNTDTSPHYPSSYNAPNVVSVAATTSTDAKASFSNYGAASVDLGAPGASILSTVRNSSYATYSGTSMASPHVAGVGALVLSACSMGVSALKDLILSTVDSVASMSGITVTGGRLNADRAVRTCTGAPAPDPVAPSAPSNLTAAGGDAQVALSWSASSGATSYAVRRRVQGQAAFTEIASGLGGTSYTDQAVTNGTTYEYAVTARANGLESDPSNVATATPAAAPAPAAPANLRASTTGKRRIDLAWNASTGAASYLVKRSTSNGGPYTVVATRTTTSFSDTGLVSNRRYYYVVTAVNSAGAESGNSNQATAVAR